MINVFYFMIYLRFLSYKGRKVKLIKGSRISGGPDIFPLFLCNSNVKTAKCDRHIPKKPGSSKFMISAARETCLGSVSCPISYVVTFVGHLRTFKKILLLLHCRVLRLVANLLYLATHHSEPNC